MLLNEEMLENVSEFPISESKLMRLVGTEVSDVRFDCPSGNLMLKLSRGHELHIDGDVGDYEAYQVFDGQGVWIV